MEINHKMRYEEKWKILADLLIELQKRGEKIPADVMNDLRSAKTIIQVQKADPVHNETRSRIDEYMRNVESYGIFTAEKQGIENVENWLKKIKNPKKTENIIKNETVPRFILGIPRDMKWLRVKTSNNTPLEEVKKFVSDTNLSFKIQEKGYILVYGNEKRIKSFVKKMTQRFRDIRDP